MNGCSYYFRQFDKGVIILAIKDKHFKIEPLAINHFISVNELKEVTNPIFFDGNNGNTSDGLLSNEIFGITKNERANTFAYISLGPKEVFMHPLFYKVWTKMDSRIKECVHGTKFFKIVDGDLVEDDNGQCGIKFLRDNFDKIKIKRTDSSRRDTSIEFLQKFKKRMFIENMVVIPAYWRDVNSTGKYTGVGDINKLYNSLLTASKALSESYDYGLNLSDSVRGRIQEILGQLYDYFTKGIFNGQPVTGIAGKFGVLRRANLSKTTDYSARIVLSAPDLAVENIEDMITDIDHTAVPLAACCSNFYPYMMFYIRRFFENTFSGKENFPVVDKTNHRIELAEVQDYQIAFSDERIKEELDRFIHGTADRFRVIEVPLKNKRKQGNATLRFNGYKITEEEYLKMTDKGHVKDYPFIDRPMTWCDLFYMAAVEVTRDKAVLITRYPMDSYFNQFPTKINVSSTMYTTPMVIGNTFYKFYPQIDESEIGTNTTSKFTDTLKISNAYLGSIGGDYDGDQVSCKSVYSIEANAELIKQINSKSHFISLGGKNIMSSSNEGRQALFNLTMVLPDDQSKISPVSF